MPAAHSGSALLAGYRTKTDLVYLHLRQAIVDGTYAPGSRIVLDQVASNLAVSKVPVREAVTRLIGEGWLTTSPHVGPVVPQLSAQEVEETAVIRAGLETPAVERAVPLHDAASVAELEELLTQMAAAFDDPAVDFSGLNVALHRQVIGPCPLRQLRDLAVDMMERTLRYQTVHRVGGYQEEAHAEHEAIVRAVADGEAAAAADLTRRHIIDAAVKLRERLP